MATADMRQTDQRGPGKLADLVFDGGGVKGVALVGALNGVERAGYTPFHIAGTSSGAIVAALVAAGYTSTEIYDIAFREGIAKLADNTWEANIPLVGPALSILIDTGIHKGDRILRLLRQYLGAKGIRTFRDLLVPNADLPQHRYRLQVIASDLTTHSVLILPRDAEALGVAPDDLEVALAVRMSSSIPFFFEPVRFHNPKTREEHLIVDGGLFSSFPVFLFDSPNPPRWPTFGLKLVAGDPSQPLGAEVPAMTHDHGVGAVVDLLNGLLHTITEAHDRLYLPEASFARTITIPVANISSTNFNLTREQIDTLYADGQQAAAKFFQTWDFQRYVAQFRTGQPLPTRRELVTQPARREGYF